MRFADLADYKIGRTPPRAHPAYWTDNDVGIPWVTISDMTEFGIITQTKENISLDALRDTFHGDTVPIGTLIMSFKLTIGRVAILGVAACHNEAIISIYPRKGIDQRFLGYSLAQFDYLSLQDRQLKGETLNQGKINRITIPLPPRDEQTRISDILDLVRQAIKIQNETLATIQALKRSTMQTLFTQGLRGEARKETAVGAIPKSWDVQTVAASLHPLRLEPDKRIVKSDYRDTGRWPIIDQSREEISGYTDDPSRIILPETPWIMFGDHTRIFKFIDFPCALGPNGAKALVAGSDFIPKFLFHLCSSLDIPHRGYNRHHGLLNTIPIPKPELQEQRDIVHILDTIDHKHDLHRRKHRLLETLFRTLLPALTSGKIRVCDLDLSILDTKHDAEVGA